MKSFIILAIICSLIGFGAYESYIYIQKQEAKQQAASTAFSDKPDDLEILQPKPDILNGKQALIDPITGGTLQVKTNQGIVITLTIPPLALKKSQIIKLVPFIEDGNRTTLDTGVLISPSNINFNIPVTLTFKLKDSPVQNNAPKTIQIGASSITGHSHIYKVIPKKQSITPILVIRPSETNIHIAGRLVSGGSYVLSLVSTRSEALSRVVLADKKSLPLSLLEAAAYLIGNQKELSNHEKKTAMAAVNFILATPSPSVIEMFSATALQTHLSKTTSKQTTVYLQEQCQNPNLTPDEYYSAAATAQITGDTFIEKYCSEALNTTHALVPSLTQETLLNTASPSAANISNQIDALNVDSVTNQISDEDNYNNPLSTVQDPTPTFDPTSDLKF